jgi:hypothetical protein
MKGLRLIALAHGACPHEIPDNAPIMLNEELSAKALQGFLNPLMSSGMRQLKHVIKHGRGCWHKDAPLVQQEAVAD